MKRPWNPNRRGRRAGQPPVAAASPPPRDVGYDPLRHDGALRAQAAQATLDALLRRHLPPRSASAVDARATAPLPLALAGWKARALAPERTRASDLPTALPANDPLVLPAPAIDPVLVAGHAHVLPSDTRPPRGVLPSLASILQALFRIS